MKLEEIITQYKTQNKHYTPKQLIEDLAAEGYFVDRSTVYRDLVCLSRGNTFVIDIAQSRYSEMIENCFNILEESLALTAKWLEEPPEIITKKFQADKDNPGKTILVGIIKETISPITILERRIEIGKLMLEALNGDLINTSVQLISDEFQRLQEEESKWQAGMGRNNSSNNSI